MAVTDFSAAYQDGISPGLKHLQDMLNIDLPGTEVFYNPNVPGVLKPHRPGHIGRRIGAIGADHRNNFGFKGFNHSLTGLQQRQKLIISGMAHLNGPLRTGTGTISTTLAGRGIHLGEVMGIDLRYVKGTDPHTGQAGHT